MIVGPEHIAAAVMGRFHVSQARIPCVGGLWYGRVSEDAASPYGLLTVSAEEPNRLSDARYHRGFAVRIAVWGESGPGIAGGVSVIMQAVEAMMTGLSVPEAIKVVDVKLGAGEITVEDVPRNAKDVCMASREWRVLIEGQGP